MPEKRIRETRHQGRTIRYVADELVLKLKDQYRNDPEARKNVLRSLPKDSKLLRGFDDLGMVLVNLPESMDPLQVARELEREDAVEFAEPNFLDSALPTTLGSPEQG